MEKTLLGQYVCYHDVINASIGDFGRFQGIVLVFTVLLNMFSSWSINWINFQSDTWYVEDVVNNGTRIYENCTYVQEHGINLNDIVFSRGNDTMIGEFNMVCDRAGIGQLIKQFQLSASMVGAMALGQLGDTYGRKDGMVFTYLVLLLFAFIEGFSVNYFVVIMCRTMMGFAASALLVISQIWLLEFVGIKVRTKLAAVPGWQFGYIILGIVAHIWPSWRTHLVVLSLLGIPMFILFVFSPESTRWLFVQGRLEDAKKDLQKAAARNKMLFAQETFNEITVEVVEAKKYQCSYTTMNLVGNKQSRGKILPFIFMWFTTSFGYYVHGIQTSRLKDDSANILVHAAVEMFLILLLYILTRRVGRQYTIATAFILVSIASIAITILYAWKPPGIHIQLFHDIFAWTSRGILSALSFCLILLTAENFPTVVRTSACGLAYVGFFAGAIVGIEADKWYAQFDFLPFALISALTVASTFCCLGFEDTTYVKIEDYYGEEYK